MEGLIAEEIARLYSQPVTDKELQRVRIALRRAAENRITALSRAQALADAAAVYNDPNRVNTEIPSRTGRDSGRYRTRRQSAAGEIQSRRGGTTMPAAGRPRRQTEEASNENRTFSRS